MIELPQPLRKKDDEDFTNTEVRLAVRWLKDKIVKGDGSPRTVFKESINEWIDETFCVVIKK